jgi:hypothetical protein
VQSVHDKGKVGFTHYDSYFCLSQECRYAVLKELGTCELSFSGNFVTFGTKEKSRFFHYYAWNESVLFLLARKEVKCILSAFVREETTKHGRGSSVKIEMQGCALNLFQAISHKTQTTFLNPVCL